VLLPCTFFYKIKKTTHPPPPPPPPPQKKNSSGVLGDLLHAYYSNLFILYTIVLVVIEF
jgi:hypothetical protein